MFRFDGRRLRQALLNGRQNLDALDRIDAQVGVQAHVRVEHFDGVLPAHAADCFLPFEPDLPWDDYIVRVRAKELPSLPRRIADHFAGLTKAGLADQKRKCREMWDEWLSFGNYHRRVARSILETQ